MITNIIFIRSLIDARGEINPQGDSTNRFEQQLRTMPQVDIKTSDV